MSGSTFAEMSAQAQAEGLILVTRDADIPLYGIRTMAA